MSDITVKLSYEEQILNALSRVRHHRGENVIEHDHADWQAIRVVLQPLYDEIELLVSRSCAICTPVTCDGCGYDTKCLIVQPTLDDTSAYQLCWRCMHNAARIDKFPDGPSSVTRTSESERVTELANSGRRPASDASALMPTLEQMRHVIDVERDLPFAAPEVHLAEFRRRLNSIRSGPSQEGVSGLPERPAGPQLKDI